MRKLMLGFALFSLFAGSAVAQIFEMDLDYYYVAQENLELKDSFDAVAEFSRSSIPLGFEINFDIPFSDPEKSFVAGLNVETGFDIGGFGANEKVKLGKVEYTEDIFTFGYFVSAGALLRLNLGSWNSISFRPGIQVGMSYCSVTPDSGVNDASSTEITSLYSALSLNAGYKLWFSPNPRNRGGLSVGVDYDIPLYGSSTITYSSIHTENSDFDITGKSSLRVYVGVSFAIGEATSTQVTANPTPSAGKSAGAGSGNSAGSVSGSDPGSAASSGRKRSPSADRSEQPSSSGTEKATVDISADSGVLSASPAGSASAATGRAVTGSIDTGSLSKEQLKKVYNLKLNDRIAGPYSIATIALMAKTGLITSETPVRSKAVGGWVKIGVLSEFSPLFK